LIREGSPDSMKSARGITRGMQLREQNKETKGFGVNIPKVKELDQLFDKHIGPLISDPDSREFIKTGATNLLLANQFDANKLGADFDEDDYTDTLNKMIGEPIDWNGTKVLPIRNQDPRAGGKFHTKSYMKDLLEEMTSAQILKSHGAEPHIVTYEGKVVPITLETNQSGLRLQMISDGRYRMYHKDGMLVNKDWDGVAADSFVLDLYKLDKVERLEKTWYEHAMDYGDELINGKKEGKK